ncbi:(2Fe-2S) ferredoxin domain-containing protein [Mycoplasmatota bacterium WC44]
MKSLEELKKLRDKVIKQVDMRQTKDGYRIAVGMATCGISSGARPILNAFVEQVSEKNLGNVIVTQVGCIGKCALEPMVEVFDHDGGKTTYCKLTPEDVKTIIEEHVINGNVVKKLEISSFEQ